MLDLIIWTGLLSNFTQGPLYVITDLRIPVEVSITYNRPLDFLQYSSFDLAPGQVLVVLEKEINTVRYRQINIFWDDFDVSRRLLSNGRL